MRRSISEVLADAHALSVYDEAHPTLARELREVANHVRGARDDLRRFLDERTLSDDAVEEIEEIIKCLD